MPNAADETALPPPVQGVQTSPPTGARSVFVDVAPGSTAMWGSPTVMVGRGLITIGPGVFIEGRDMRDCLSDVKPRDPRCLATNGQK